MNAVVRSEGSVNEAVVYVAFELGAKDWKLALTSGLGVRPLLRTIPSRDLEAVRRVLTQGRARLKLPASARVVSCYEAGRDGFWLHRALQQQGVENHVVDSASIEVNRRARRAKTDRLDAEKLVGMLVRVCAGDRHVWAEVQVPSAEAEAARQVSRERRDLVKDRTRLRNQITSWLVTYGCGISGQRWRRPLWWTEVRDWAGQPLPASLQARIARAVERLTQLQAQIAALDAQEAAAVRAAAPTAAVRRLVQLQGIGVTGASILMAEGIAWRGFRNRRQVGGLLGFAPVPYASGDTVRDQGIQRAGNRRLQQTMVQLAWRWVQWQPDSALTRWYHARFGGAARQRKVGIVALARKLLVALWRCATAGTIPAGAQLKAA